MSLKVSKAKLKKIVNLQRRLRRENEISGKPVYGATDREHVTLWYADLARDQRKRVRSRRKERVTAGLLKTARSAIDAYNALSKPGTSNRGTKIYDFLTPEIAKKKPSKLKAFIKTLKRVESVPRGEQLAQVKAAVSSLVPFKKGARGAVQSISLATRTAADKIRVALGMASLNDETYYINFLKAALRTGAWDLYQRALKGGFDFVGELYKRGFSIHETYTHTDEVNYAPEYYSDQQLLSMGINIDDPNTFPEPSAMSSLPPSEYGESVSKSALNLLRRRF